MAHESIVRNVQNNLEFEVQKWYTRATDRLSMADHLPCALGTPGQGTSLLNLLMILTHLTLSVIPSYFSVACLQACSKEISLRLREKVCARVFCC